MTTIRSRAHFKIHPGKLDEFKRLSTQCMQRTREKDKGTRAYEIFFNNDETECVVYEEYVDSQACIDHFKNMGELADAIFKIVDAEG